MVKAFWEFNKWLDYIWLLFYIFIHIKKRLGINVDKCLCLLKKKIMGRSLTTTPKKKQKKIKGKLKKSNFISLIQNFSFYILDWSKNLTFQNVQVRLYVIYYAFVIFFFLVWFLYLWLCSLKRMPRVMAVMFNFGKDFKQIALCTHICFPIFDSLNKSLGKEPKLEVFKVIKKYVQLFLSFNRV